MQERYIFREMLSEIKELADQKGNVLTLDEVKEFFKNAAIFQARRDLCVCRPLSFFALICRKNAKVCDFAHFGVHFCTVYSSLLVHISILQPTLKREARAAEHLRCLGEIAAGKLHCLVDIRALKGIHLVFEVDTLLREVVHWEAAARTRAHSQQCIKACFLARKDTLTAEEHATLHHIA